METCIHGRAVAGCSLCQPALTLTVEATCKACGSPRDPMAIAYAAHCSVCFGCFTCGRTGVGSSITAHVCPGVPVVATTFGATDILATGPMRPDTEGNALVGAGAYPPRGARREGREAPGAEQMSAMFAGTSLDPALPDLEACARAAYEASWRHDPAVLPWHLLGDDLQDRAREVARAVLAAAGVTR